MEEIDIIAVEGTDFVVVHIVFEREIVGVVVGYLSSKVALVSNEHIFNMALVVFHEFVKPSGFDFIEGLFVGNFKKEDGPDDIPIVVFDDGVVKFLPGGVPNVNFDDRSVGNNGEGGSEFNTDGGIFVGWSIGDACEEGGFSDSGVTNEDDFI